MNFFKKLVKPAFLFVVFWPNIVFADDIGINSARLIQLSDTSYLLEADFSQQVIMDFEMPIFPERFELSYPEYEDKSGWITIRTIAVTSGQALNSKDEILLPWRRNGISLTVQWLDGTIHQGLFLRSMDGIHVPLNLLMSTKKTIRELTLESFIIGLKHTRFGYIHLLLILALVFFLPKRQIIPALVVYAFGQASSMLLFELGLHGFDLLYIDLLILFLVIALTVSSIKKIAFNYRNLVLFIIGLLHGLSVGTEIKSLDLPLELELVFLFICNLTIDLEERRVG